MRRAHLATLAGLILLSACATQSASRERDARAAQPTEASETAFGGGGAILLDNTLESIDARFAVPLERIWEVLPGAYAALGIEIQHVDAAEHVLGNRQLSIRRRLGGVRASSYFDCGRHAVTGQASADNFQLTASVTTQVLADGEDGALVITSVGAFGRPISGTSSNDVRCSSRGKIEEEIVEFLTDAVGPAGSANR
ncbi:MAG: hypothetical protein RQ745_10470 [Longimicrobiales bacterium]|nr:hypothetical protein [Longimicrobiales bacterium]